MVGDEPEGVAIDRARNHDLGDERALRRQREHLSVGDRVLHGEASAPGAAHEIDGAARRAEGFRAWSAGALRRSWRPRRRPGACSRLRWTRPHGRSGNPSADGPAAQCARTGPPGEERYCVAATDGTGSSACSSTSPTVITGWNVIASRTSCGTSSRSAAVALGQDHVGQARRVRGQHLLLEPADRQHAALQRDLAGHADRVLDRAAAEQRRERRGHRDAGARAVLGDRARRDVDVEVALLEEPRVDPELLGVGPHVGQRDLRRLLHHVAELAGELQVRRPSGLASRWPR